MARGEHAAADPGGHPLFARFWSRISGSVGSDRQRAELLAGLRGRVLEVGAGDGRNFALYPGTVAHVTAVEPEPYLRARAERAAARAPVPVTVAHGAAEALSHDDGCFDAAVCSLVLCSVSDQRLAIAELARVLAPGAELRFFEHVIAEHRVGAAIQSGLDASGVWPRMGGGCHLARDTLAALAAGGFAVQAVRRLPSGPAGRGIPFVLGRALLTGG